MFFSVYCVFLRFDINWLKDPAHHTTDGIQNDQALSEGKKRVLLGIHTRHVNLADKPSKTDWDFLTKCYKNRTCIYVVFNKLSLIITILI